MSGGRTVLVWFRKSLRVHDNGPLIAAINYASEHGRVLPVFILDKWTSKGENVGDVRFEFLMQSLRCLDKNLKARGLPKGLLFVQGEPEVVMPTLWKSFGVDAMAWDNSEENEVHDRARDKAISALAAKHSVHTMHDQHTHWLHSPLDYMRALKGKPVPSTYTQFTKIFDQLGPVAAPLPAPASIPFQLTGKDLDKMSRRFLQLLERSATVKGERGPLNTDITVIPSKLRSPVRIKFPGGEDEGLGRLDRVVAQQPQWTSQFEKPKTSPNSLRPSTTVLSPYLTHGCVSMRTAWHTVQQTYRKFKGSHSQPPVSLLGQFMWHEFWYTVAHFTPVDISKMEGNPLSRQIPWDNVVADPDARQRLERWTLARTGYPFIDAVMTQLRSEGWIHHLGRHAVACFLTRGDLWVSWEQGMKVFDRYLIDADWTVNACNWMWLSCSAFFHQYYRCYSPVAFGKKTDPEGLYIRKYLPQLKRMPKKYIYEPWKAPPAVQEQAGCVVGQDYPLPLVPDHGVTSKLNMDKMKKAFAAKPLAKAMCPYIPGSVPPLPPTTAATTITVFSSQFTAELENAIKVCLKLSPEGDCSKGPHGPMGKWDVSSITDMSFMFSNAIYFNGDISKWDVSSVTSMSSMFIDAHSFNADISKWDVSSVTDMSFMFSNARLFNSDISKWHVSSVNDLNGVFFDANAFNGDISKWDVSSVRNMYAMFYEAASFNGDLSKWDVSRVTDMKSMFARASSFHGDISKWDVSSVKYMSGMFMSAAAFNCDISKWDVSSVTNMDYMFHEATSLNLNLCQTAWVQSKASKVGMFDTSSGRVTRRCKAVPTRPYVSRRPMPDRELIVRTSISTAVSSPVIGPRIASTMTCPKCGMFKKSGRVSCCAPGGTWFKNCGGDSNRNVDHKWFEGVEACKPATTTMIIFPCLNCVPIKKSGKTSCCGRGGSWFEKCGGAGNSNLDHTWYEGIRACKSWAQPKIALVQQSNAAQQLNLPNFSGMGNSKTVTTAVKIFTFTSVNKSTTAPDSTSTVHSIVLHTTNTVTAAITATATTAHVNLTAKEATIVTDWISQKFFVTVIIFVCVISLLLITLTVTRFFFIHKDSTIKKEFTGVSPQPDPNNINKDVNLY